MDQIDPYKKDSCLIEPCAKKEKKRISLETIIQKQSMNI